VKKLLLVFLVCASFQIQAQGTWTPLKNKTPLSNGSVILSLLMTDGTVLVKTDSIENDGSGQGTRTWAKLTPDSHGSYVNGTWSVLPKMTKDRLYFSSQVMKDGRVVVIGGENGNGTVTGEIYDPVLNTWTLINTPKYTHFLDGNSELLPDGKIIVSEYNGLGFFPTYIYDPVLNVWTTGPSCHGNADEAAWLKLPDYSILFVDMATRHTERYIPALNNWLVEDTVQVSLYDPYGDESGPAYVLPDGRGFFIGSMPVTAFYTPTGDTSKGLWTAGPALPDTGGMPDAAGAMMINGKILLAISHTPDSATHFPKPMSFYEFNYLDNSFTEVASPNGADTLDMRTANTTMLDLPDGTVLLGSQSTSQMFVYTPSGTPLAQGKPTISGISQSGCTFTVTGTLFNGITMGAAYGDDWQMSTNRPIIRLTSDSNVYYVKTMNWNLNGIQTGTQPDTVQFTVPANVPTGGYALVVTANGIASDTLHFNYVKCVTGIDEAPALASALKIYPNPASGQVAVSFTSTTGGPYIVRIADMLGRTVLEESDVSVAGTNMQELNLEGISSGVYLISVQQKSSVSTSKILVR